MCLTYVLRKQSAQVGILKVTLTASSISDKLYYCKTEIGKQEKVIAPLYYGLFLPISYFCQIGAFRFNPNVGITISNI